jgi:hypothetical protein
MLYGYKDYKPLTPEEILKRVSEKDIFSIVIKEPIVDEKGAYYKAPYRLDTNPDCYFEKYNGSLKFVDHADYQRVKSCFGVIQRAYNITYNEALRLVNSHFNLGLGDNIRIAKEVFIENDYVEEEKIVKSFKERIITYLPRQFNCKDKEFWNKYGISKQNLIDDKVIPIEMYRSISRKGEYFTIRCMDICYAYTDFPNGKVKIYRPYGTKEGKWFTNCNQNDIGSMEHLPEEGDLLFIMKAYKDCRIMRNLGFHACWNQAEGMIPSETVLKDLCSRFKKIIVWFDNDSTGITNSRFYTEILNSITPNKAKSIMLPPRLLSEHIKDPSDLYEKKGEDSLLEFLRTKRIL